MSVPIILRRNTPFSFPAGRNPGIDLSHIAAGIPRFSGIASGNGSFINLMTGAPGTVAGTPTAVSDGYLGRATNFATSTDAVTFSGNPAVLDSVVTFGAIALFTSITGNQGIFNSATVGADGWLFYVSNQLTLFANNSTVSSGTNLVGNIPYFLICSTNSSVTNFLWMRLDNGVVSTATTSSLTSLTSNGTYKVASDNFGNATNSRLAAVMFSAGIFMSISQMLQWAQDPWSYWYPGLRDQLLFKGIQGSQSAPPVITPSPGGNLMMMGMG